MKRPSRLAEEKPLTGKVVALGITGSVAAYKGAEVARRLMDLGADVHVALTRAGAEFITPLSLRSLTGNPVTVDMFDEPEQWEIAHVSLAQRAAAVVVAPATADAIAKLALGLADEFIYAVALATTAPLFIAPAMNDRMMAHGTVQENLARLRGRGAHIIEAETGRLASGAVGQGRLADPERIAGVVAEAVAGAGELKGVRVLVTAGPTREPLDPVRFLSNRSSGKMGYALAEAAIRRGAQVTVVSGPTSLPAPAGCEVVAVETTQQMHDAVMSRLPQSEVVVGAAAPADYAPIAPASRKLKKARQSLALELRPTPDILAECGRRKRAGQVLVGFAAETQHVMANARAKLKAKKLDMIVANDVSREGIGFEADQNAGHLLLADGRKIELPRMAKSAFAERVMEVIGEEAKRGKRRARLRR